MKLNLIIFAIMTLAGTFTCIYESVKNGATIFFAGLIISIWLTDTDLDTRDTLRGCIRLTIIISAIILIIRYIL